MVPEARLEETETGLVPVSAGWFVLNARDARWSHRSGRQSVSFTGKTDFEADTLFPQLGVNLFVLAPAAAKHAATTFIEEHRPKSRPTLYARSQGSASLLAAIREYLVAAKAN